MYKVATAKGSFFVRDRVQAQEQASIISHKYRVAAYVVEIAPCIVCNGEREDDLSRECNGCLMEMAKYYGEN